MAGANCGAAGQNTGPWNPVNSDDPPIKGLGNFAVTTYNNDNGTSLVFKSVVSGLVLSIQRRNFYALTLQVVEGQTQSSPQVLISESENATPQLWLWMDLQKIKFYGTWTPVPDDTNIIGKGKFAVTEHNSENGTSIVFRKVDSGSQWTGFDAINFYGLTLRVEDGQTPTPKVLISEIPSKEPTLLFWAN